VRQSSIFYLPQYQPDSIVTSLHIFVGALIEIKRANQATMTVGTMHTANLGARPHAFHGTLIHATSSSKIEILKNTLIAVDSSGTITDIKPDVSPEQAKQQLSSLKTKTDPNDLRILDKHDFLIPGFIDTHNHAPQFAQRGLGQGLHILDWLNKLTFPNEAKFADPEYARAIYEHCVDGFIKQGITSASYYGSLHGEATKALAEICMAKGQRALVGKCNMDRNSPEYCSDASAEESLRVTREFVAHVESIDPRAEMVRPILTPRFAISCSNDLLSGLGQLARERPDLPIQTHFNEAQQEIDATLSLFPNFTRETDLYRHYSLLTPRTILAHCTIMTDDEMDALAKLGCGIAHCPIANNTIGGGFMAAPIRQFLTRGMKVGLGTDSGGGFSSSILDGMRQALIVSNAREAQTAGADKALSLDETFYMATLGGARVCGLDEKVGSFEIGKQFDALLVRPNLVLGDRARSVLRAEDGVMTLVEDGDSVRTVFEKFLVSGDDRNIAEVFVRGRQIKKNVAGR
jgi:guanine deaminase